MAKIDNVIALNLLESPLGNKDLIIIPLYKIDREYNSVCIKNS